MLIHSFTVYWESYLRSDRLKIKDKVLCAGWGKVDARNEQDAIRIWKEMFPKDRVVKVS